MKCTTGIWMWTVNVTIDGEDITLLVLDNEGMSAGGSGENDAKIFALSMLLSSVLMFNSLPGNLEENSIDDLCVLNRLSNVIKPLPSFDYLDNIENLYRLSAPRFCWILRDFCQNLVDATGTEISTNEFMENYLLPRPQDINNDINSVGTSGGGKDRNNLRHSLKSLFPDRKCFALARPIFDEAALRTIEKCPASMLRPEFTANLDDLRQAVMGSLPIKKMCGRSMSGAMLSDLIDFFVQSLNRSGVIELSDSIERISRRECDRAFDLATDRYFATMATVTSGVEVALLESTHDAAFASSMSLYDSLSFGPYCPSQRAALMKTLMSERGRAIESNYAASAAACDILARELFQTHIHPKLYPASGPSLFEGSPEGLAELWASMGEAYYAAARGPAKKVVFSELCQQRMIEAAVALTGGIRTRYEGQLRVLQVSLSLGAPNSLMLHTRCIF